MEGTAHRADAETISSRKAISLVGGEFSGIGINEKDVTLSHSSFHRQREAERTCLAKSIKSGFDQSAWYALHWDGKKLRGMQNVDESKDHVAVVLTNLISGEEKILDIPALSTGKSKETTEAIVNIYREWGILQRIIAVVFDTANTNSGCLHGVAVSLEKNIIVDITSMNVLVVLRLTHYF